ncbi:hypothetical protein CAPTEDRAFT_49795, partial [Capitella teleta]|uniref:CARD domain-containing protein n=1 Tax=Capitella teleta TaxID=283909 RepID=X2B564_CAPTE
VLLIYSMENSHRQLLNDHLVVLATDLDPSDIYAHLIEGKVLTADDVELVNAQVTRREKVLKLMFMLPRRGPHAFEIFAAAL